MNKLLKEEVAGAAAAAERAHAAAETSKAEMEDNFRVGLQPSHSSYMRLFTPVHILG